MERGVGGVDPGRSPGTPLPGSQGGSAGRYQMIAGWVQSSRPLQPLGFQPLQEFLTGPRAVLKGQDRVQWGPA